MSFVKEVGRDKLLGLVKTNGEWQVSLSENVNIYDLTLQGVGLRGADVVVSAVRKNIVTLSFFGVPYYIGNDELSA